MTDIPDNEPASLRVGDTWRWTRTLADYPAGTWALKYRFKNASGGFEVVATASGTDHDITVAATTTAGYTAGDYSWASWVEGGSSEVYTVETGKITLLPSYRAGVATAALDDRTHAQKALAAIEAWIESRDPGVAEYEIAGRRMKYWSAADLIKWRQKYKAEVDAEINAVKLANGEGIGRKIQFRI